MNDFITAQKTQRGMEFALAVSRLIVAMKVAPGEALVAFGSCAASLVEWEVLHERAERGSAIEAAVGIFGDSVVAACDANSEKGPLQ